MSNSNKQLDFNEFDLRKLDLTRKYDDDFSPADSISWREHILLYMIAGLILLFLIWANIATLDEVARGDGKVIPSSEVQVIQNLEGGIIDAFLVKEGDAVNAGQTILRMRNVQAGADFAATNQKYLGLLAATTRLQAEANGTTPVFPQEVTASAPDALKAEQDAFAANKKQYDNQATVLSEQLAQKQQEVTELQQRITNTSKLLKLSQDQHNITAPLAAEGYASKKDLIRVNQEIAQQQTELDNQQLSLPRVQAAVKEIEGRITSLESDFRAAAQKELATKTSEMNTIQKTLVAYQDRSARNEIKSPVHGMVKDIKIKTVGGVAKPGEPIMEIVPLGDQLLVEGRIKPSDIAFIHQGDKAIVRLSAFDFSIYGSLEGQVTDISADSITNEKGESFYRVRVKTDKTTLKKGDKEYPIIPGMQATVDIVTGKKTVMNYLLKPFIKATQTAMRER